MNRIFILTTLVLLGTVMPTCQSFAQWSQALNQYIDIGNIKALQLLNGDMWHSENNDSSQCEFPKGSGKHINRDGGIWMSGTDANGIVHNAAAFRSQDGYFDYTPGPLNDTPSKWNEVWKINRTDITSFLSHNPPFVFQPIRTWPAKGNNRAIRHIPAQSGFDQITADMAPFVDANHDGLYNPDSGDYPAIKGDQMLWWVINDGITHERTEGYPMGIEIHASAYAYKRGTAIDNVVFYEYDIFNKSPNTYENFRFGIYADAELGDGSDDYAGYDYAHRMAVTYNGNPADGNGQAGTYGNQPPMTGLTLLEAPGDYNGISKPAGSFMVFNNDLSPNGMPLNNIEYNYLMHAQQRNGDHLSISCGPLSGQPANYAYPGSPGDATGWSECSCGNTPGDRRFVLSTDDYTLPAGAHIKVAFALLATDSPGDHTCPGASFTDIQRIADTAWQWYRNPHTPQGINPAHMAQKTLKLWPNPAQQTLFIETPSGENGKLLVYDALGRLHELPILQNNKTAELNITSLPAGVYSILYQAGNTGQSGIFVKQ